MKITFEGEKLSAIILEMEAFVDAYPAEEGAVSHRAVDGPTYVVTTETTETVERTAVGKPNKKRGRPKKAAAEQDADGAGAGAPVDAAGSAPAPSADPAPEASIEDVRAALTSLMNAKGMDAVTALMGDYGARRVSDLEPAQYDAILRAVELATARR